MVLIKKLKNISLRKKITIGFFLPLILVAAFGAYSYKLLKKTSHNLNNVKELNLNLAEKAQRMIFLTKDMQEEATDIAATQGQSESEKTFKKIAKDKKELYEILDEFSIYYKERNKNIFQLIGMIKGNVETFDKSGKAMALQFIKLYTAHPENKQNVLNKGLKAMKKYDRASDTLNMFLAPFVDDQVKRLKSSIDQSNKQLQSFIYKFFTVLPICFLFAFFMIVIINKILSNHFKILTDFSTKLGAGDLRAKIITDATDETGKIAQKINLAVDNLQLMILQILNSSNKLGISSKEMNKISKILSTSSLTLDHKSTEVSASSKEMMATNQGVVTSIDHNSRDISDASQNAEKISKDLFKFVENLDGNVEESNLVYDSLKSMSDNFNNFISVVEKNTNTVTNVGASISKIKDQNNKVTLQALNTEKLVANVDQHIDTMNNNFNEIVTITNDTKINTNEMNNDLKNVTQKVKSIAQKIQDSNQENKNVVANLKSLDTSIESVSNNMIKASAVVDQATVLSKESLDSVESLVKAASQVNEVIAFIEEIARQTTLLSLNASIEASRAGEAGKGFSVVANEVKDLAQNTHDKTDEIRASIKSITKFAEIVNKKIKNSETVISEINETTHQVKNAIEDQVNSTKLVNTSMNLMQESSRNILVAAEQTSDLSQQVLSKGNELNKKMNVVSNYVQDFSDKSKEMKKNIVLVLENSNNSTNMSKQAVANAEIAEKNVSHLVQNQNEMKDKIIFFSHSTQEVTNSLEGITTNISTLQGELATLGSYMKDTSENFHHIEDASQKSLHELNGIITISKSVSKAMFEVNHISNVNITNANSISDQTNTLIHVSTSLNDHLKHFVIPKTIQSSNMIAIRQFIKKETELSWEKVIQNIQEDLNILVIGELHYLETQNKVLDYICSNTDLKIDDIRSTLSLDNQESQIDNHIDLEKGKKENTNSTEEVLKQKENLSDKKNNKDSKNDENDDQIKLAS